MKPSDFNMGVGHRFPLHRCCGEFPIVTEYHERLFTLTITHKCMVCGNISLYSFDVSKRMRREQIRHLEGKEVMEKFFDLVDNDVLV